MNSILPRIKVKTKNSPCTSKRVKVLIDTLAENHRLMDVQYQYILDHITEEESSYLYERAYEAKLPYYQNRVFLRGLIEISNYCKRGCKYCGINRTIDNVKRYRLSKEDILQCCQNGYDLGYRTFVLQGGEDPHFTDDLLVDIIQTIHQKFPECRVTLSLGERSYASYKALYDAGARRYLLRHEAASKRLYDHLHPVDSTYEGRMECLHNLKNIGFQTGAGFMVGSPTQTNEDIVKDLLFLQEFKPHMIGIGPYLCHEDTALKGNDSGTLQETMIMVALVRLIHPNVLLPATTALGTLHPWGREQALQAGANVLMPNISPKENLALYQIYQNKTLATDTDKHNRDITQKRVASVHHVVDFAVGDVLNMKG